MKTISLLFLLLAILFSSVISAAHASIRSVSISREFFNPSIGQTVEISFDIGRSGLLSLKIIDRDGYVVKTLIYEKKIEKGKCKFSWDGETNDGTVIPDESYSLWIELKSNSGTDIYFPGNHVLAEETAELGYYDRKRGIISYKLPKPARVHVQAGVATVDPTTKEVEGPVMATVVNRKSRSSGWIAENWNGFAESDSLIYIPDLQNFKLAVAATRLPENSIIATGNNKQGFMQYAAKRNGKSIFTFQTLKHHQHHQGLTSLEDSSPSLVLQPQNAQWIEQEKMWVIKESSLKIRGRLDGDTALSFSKQPGSLILFVNGREVQKMNQPCSNDFQIEIPEGRLSFGNQIIAANCASEYGPTAAFSLRVIKKSATKISAKE